MNTINQVSLEEESQDISLLEKYVVAPRMFKYVTSKGNFQIYLIVCVSSIWTL